MTVGEARIQALEILLSPLSTDFNAGGDSPSLDILLILAFYLGVSKTQLLAHPEMPLGIHEGPFFDAIALRKKGFPVAYITGTKEFWGLPFKVNPTVLIPKADTEILVERAIAVISSLRETQSQSGLREQPVQVLDVCTGSGCIAVALGHSCPGITITATDISPEALKVARENAANLPILFIESDLRNPFPRKDYYDLIVSNPPYVPSAAASALLDDGRGEPLLALDGGEDGLDLVRPLIQNARTALVPGGTLLVETGEYHAKEAADYLNLSGFIDIVIHKDLEGQDRVIEGRQP